PWIAWTPCSVTCGGVGVRSRKRCQRRYNCEFYCSMFVLKYWFGWSHCSASCISKSGGDAIIPSRVRHRSCSNPSPSNNTSPPGNSCPGDAFQVQHCKLMLDRDTPKHCSESCISQGRAVRRTRQRSCSNPAPSSNPPGQDCQGHSHQTENCDHLPFCPVDGGWGSWSPFSSCPVTCGVGLQVSVRRCDSPATQHGGRPCPGEGRQTRICSTKVHCPVDGVWSEWSEWKQCKFPGGRNIRCKKTAGSHLRSRHCLHRAHNGTICIGDNLTEMQVCYDIEGCDLKGRRDPWTSWSLCEPPCGKNSIRSRKKICKPEYSGYKSVYQDTANQIMLQ
uniref:Complement factor properdin n=1 Tax=Amphilophus citrinellus TaxID=61819 RepID=A0A3Q0SYE4_AMPCI